MTHKILRIEDTDGEGLYRVGEFQWSLAKRLGMTQDNCPVSPAPSADGLCDGMLAPTEQYGFANPDQLIRWMDDINPEDIYEKQGHIVEVEVSELTKGRNQIRFRPEDVISRKVLTVDQFYDTLYSNTANQLENIAATLRN